MKKTDNPIDQSFLKMKEKSANNKLELDINPGFIIHKISSYLARILIK